MSNIDRIRALSDKLDESIIELDEFFRLSPDIMCITCKRGKILKTNLAWETLLGYDPEELIGKSWATLIPPNASSESHTMPEFIPPEDTVSFVSEMLTATGTHKWVNWSACRYNSLGKRLVVGRVISDPTQNPCS